MASQHPMPVGSRRPRLGDEANRHPPDASGLTTQPGVRPLIQVLRLTTSPRWQDAKLPEAIARNAAPVDDAGKVYAELIAHFTPEGATGTFQPGPPPDQDTSPASPSVRCPAEQPMRFLPKSPKASMSTVRWASNSDPGSLDSSTERTE